MDCFDVVAVRVEQVGRVVVGGVVADARCAVVPIPALDAGSVKSSDRLAGAGEERKSGAAESLGFPRSG
jgi:hypothetical protein